MKIIVVARITYPALLDGNSSMRLITTNAQKMTTGTRISNKVTISDLASGPNINLPFKKNICSEETKKCIFIAKVKRIVKFGRWNSYKE